MSQLFFSSVTRISDLQDRPFECRELPRNSWETGDYVRCEVHGRPGPLYRVELPAGRMCQVLDGDMIIGAFGKRSATLEGTGDWEAIKEDGELNALTSAGLFGKVTSLSPVVPMLMHLKYRGHVLRDGHKVTMAQFCGKFEPRELNVPVVLMIGTSMSSGKTSSGRVIIHELKRRGLKVTAAKLTGAARYRDVLSFGDAGADHIVDFVDAGLPSSVCDPEQYKLALSKMLSKIAATDPDVVVAEAGASPLEPYNGSLAMEALDRNIRMMVLCASDPYAVLGVQQAFGREPDLVCGPAANTDAGIELVKKLCGVQALNLLRRYSRPELNRLLDMHFSTTER